MSDRTAAARIDAPSKVGSGLHPAVRRLHAVIATVRVDSTRALDEFAARVDEKIARVAQHNDSKDA